MWVPVKSCPRLELFHKANSICLFTNADNCIRHRILKNMENFELGSVKYKMNIHFNLPAINKNLDINKRCNSKKNLHLAVYILRSCDIFPAVTTPHYCRSPLNGIKRATTNQSKIVNQKFPTEKNIE